MRTIGLLRKDGVAYSNYVSDPFFEEGHSGWSCSGGTISSSGGKLTATGDGSSATVSVSFSGLSLPSLSVFLSVLCDAYATLSFSSSSASAQGMLSIEKVPNGASSFSVSKTYASSSDASGKSFSISDPLLCLSSIKSKVLRNFPPFGCFKGSQTLCDYIFDGADGIWSSSPKGFGDSDSVDVASDGELEYVEGINVSHDDISIDLLFRSYSVKRAFDSFLRENKGNIEIMRKDNSLTPSYADIESEKKPHSEITESGLMETYTFKRTTPFGFKESFSLAPGEEKTISVGSSAPLSFAISIPANCTPQKITASSGTDKKTIFFPYSILDDYMTDDASFPYSISIDSESKKMTKEKDSVSSSAYSLVDHSSQCFLVLPSGSWLIKRENGWSCIPTMSWPGPTYFVWTAGKYTFTSASFAYAEQDDSFRWKWYKSTSKITAYSPSIMGFAVGPGQYMIIRVKSDNPSVMQSSGYFSKLQKVSDMTDSHVSLQDSEAGNSYYYALYKNTAASTETVSVAFYFNSSAGITSEIKFAMLIGSGDPSSYQSLASLWNDLMTNQGDVSFTYRKCS